MELVIDGLIYQMQTHGGISRIYNHILPQMCDMDPELNVSIFTTGLVLQQLPYHQRIAHDPPQAVSRFLYPSRIWNLVYKKWIVPERKYARRSGPGSIWHSTYYTLPDNWQGRQVVTVVDMIQEKFPALFNDERNEHLREYKRRCVENADAVICISESTRQDVLDCYGISPAKTYVIHLAHSPVFQRLGLQVIGEFCIQKPYLLYVGSREAYKNFHTLLDAYHSWSWRTDYELVVVGQPWSAAEEHMLEELGIAGRVHRFYSVDDEQLCRLYNQAAAFVFPSLYEGFGIPLLEAMACGCPLVASDIPTTREVAGDIPNYFDPADSESLQAALQEGISLQRDNARVRDGLARAGKFSWERTARQMLDVYHSLN